MVAKTPAAMKSAPLTYTGAAVSRFPYMAMMGAMTPNIRFAVAVIAFPVPRSLVGKTRCCFVNLELLVNKIQGGYVEEGKQTFGRVSVKNCIHDVGHEIVCTIPSKKGI